MKLDGGLAEIQDKKIPDRQTRTKPAGIGNQSLRTSIVRHASYACPCVRARVLRPSTSLLNLMQPEMSYERGYCRPECTKCSDACPAGAISPVTVEEKSSIQIGHAVVIRENCIVERDGVKLRQLRKALPVRGHFNGFLWKEKENSSTDANSVYL